MATLALANAAPLLDAGNPVGFFTNVASRLLASELNLNLTQLQVYPTNQYTPAVHRLLQVAANVYDATSTNFYPSVFRPLFSRDQNGFGPKVFISGYEQIPPANSLNVNNPPFDPPVDISFLAATNIQVTDLGVNVYGVPWIIGARKGFPGFNAFVMENVVGVTRRLQFTRQTNSAFTVTLTGTNQMYLISLNSSLGVDLWNSYRSNYNGNVSGWVRENLSLALTNDDVGFNASPGIQQPMGGSLSPISFSCSTWPGTLPGTTGNPNSASFLVPLNGTFVLLTNSVYRSPDAYLTFGTVPPGFTAPCLVPTNYLGSLGMTLGFETNTLGFPFPHWGLLTTNQLQVFMLDQSADGFYHVIDYVHFEQTSRRDVNAEIFTDDTAGVWSTNLNLRGIPCGIANQIFISRGLPPYNGVPPAEDGLWKSDPQAAMLGGTVQDQQYSFNVFFQPYGMKETFTDKTGRTQQVSNLLSVVVAPYAPTCYGIEYTILEANDPLVHYLASDMNPSFKLSLTNHLTYGEPAPTLTNLDLGRLNKNYQPWGGNPRYYLPPSDTTGWAALTATNLCLKDPAVYSADDWNFPSGQTPVLEWIGQVHRGTPWQTIYLKASDILGEVRNGYNVGAGLWTNWTGDLDAADAAAMAPVQDRHLVSLLVSLLNTNDFRSLLSVNNPDPNVWLVRFDGLTALTNNVSDAQLSFLLNATPQFGTLAISSNSVQASVIANGIQTARSSQPNQYFRDVGDILSIPQLTEQSPFLNWNDTVQQRYGISDEAYEMIPSQLLPLLRADSIGSIAPASGPLLVQFTGYDGHAYVIQVSSNLADWTDLSTNYPVNGTFGFTGFPAPGVSPQFYRSVLLQ